MCRTSMNAQLEQLRSRPRSSAPPFLIRGQLGDVVGLLAPLAALPHFPEQLLQAGRVRADVEQRALVALFPHQGPSGSQTGG